MTAKYLIGIDLGTTNCSLSYREAAAPRGSLHDLDIPQWQDGARIKLKTLPSFVYVATKAELKKDKFRLPLHPASEAVSCLVGAGAKSIAIETNDRVIHSAKSWLAVQSVDAREAFLPHNSDSVVGSQRLSPLQVTRLLLEHLKYSWDYEVGSASGEKFVDQAIVVTIPASFDVAAQSLTEAAWLEAGYPGSTSFLEEPQAAYYHWSQGNHSQAEQLPSNRTVLVCDIGGGTTDFSLLETTGQSDYPTKRLAVSSHILLGGDNVDLAIAKQIEASRASTLAKLDSRSWAGLVASARLCKETLLNTAGGQDNYTLSISTDSADLFSSSESITMHRSDILEIMNGFVPMCPVDARPDQNPDALRPWGLPYAEDPAFTKHLAEFLAGRTVDFILFAGGTMQSEFFQEQILNCLQSWQQSAITVLPQTSAQLAISRGACLFLAAKISGSGLIEAHFPHNILLEVAGESGPMGLCVAAKDQKFGTANLIKAPIEGLVNRQVSFKIYQDAVADRVVGDLAPLASEQRFVAELTTSLQTGDKEGKEPTRVHLDLFAELTETKSLKIECRSDEKSWPLLFALNQSSGNQFSKQTSSNASAVKGISAPQLAAAEERVLAHFGKKAKNSSPGTLVTELETALGEPRSNWDIATLRSLNGLLQPHHTRRSRSAAHESSWLYLSGYTLRPGFGHPTDVDTIEVLWRVFERGLFHPKEPKVLNQWFILWRRVAGGLSGDRQDRIFDKYSPLVRQRHTTSPELLLLLGSLERVDSLKKITFGNFLEKEIRSGEKANIEAKIWCLARLASRVSLYASKATVLRAKSIEPWIESMMVLDLRQKHYRQLRLFFLLAGRLLADRELDINPHLRDKLLQHLRHQGLDEDSLVDISKYRELSETDQSQIFGEELPTGLFMKTNV